MVSFTNKIFFNTQSVLVSSKASVGDVIANFETCKRHELIVKVKSMCHVHVKKRFDHSPNISIFGQV